MQEFASAPREMIDSALRNRELILPLIKKEVIGCYPASVEVIFIEITEISNKTIDYETPEHERCLLRSDSVVNIGPIAISPRLSAKDAEVSLVDAEILI